VRLDPDQLEWIVREVVRRLQEAALPAPSAGQTRRDAPAARAEATYAPDSHVMLTDKLITTATLEFRLQGVSRVTVPARAVVTPAARDLLKERSIELVRS